MEEKISANEEQTRLLKKQLVHMRIHTATGLILTAAFLFVIIRLLPGLTQALDQANAVLADAGAAIEDLQEVSQNVNELVDSGSLAIGQTMEKIEQMDIEQLNGAIADLNRVIEPLAEFFGRFQ
ncbi:MAG TPA: hypothetical protein H9912_10950 [Candidatus Eisenbergiella stercorigallinarum]|uniref:Uncharacterized protein n=1 Tax=Candidatus Eisenbergiella stercorigallinarum TaxID=2838557 RepID=A0A9D2TZL4_9FIRM|nr:hypothetical protein [Candidatus Eisenbergiella stercorigallinarum]